MLGTSWLRVSPAILLLAVIACGGGGSSNTATPEPTASGQKLTAQVFNSVTGDIFDAVVGVQRIRYRVAGVHAPRDNECYAGESLAASTELLLGEIIQVEPAPGPEEEGAQPAYVTLQGKNVDELLLKDGLARVTPGLPGGALPEQRLTDAEAQAKTNHKGLWGACVEPPFGFTAEGFATGIENPTVMAFAPDGRLFVGTKSGQVWIVDAEGQRSETPFIDLVEEVNGEHDRGLLGLALDPDFETNGYVYLLYTADRIPGEPDEDADTPAFGRLTRYTEVGGVADPSSRLVLIGNGPEDGWPLASVTHTIGDLLFGPNRELFVSAGDGAVDTEPDVGHGTTDRDIMFSGMFPASEDIGALRAQSLDSLDGKILRINPDTGGGLETNPFWDGDPFSNRSRVFAYGMRNPFRIALRTDEPGSESLFVGDVGNKTWEEISIATAGANLGWPCYEGPTREPLFAVVPESAAVCDALSPADLTPPIYYYANAAQGTLDPRGFSGTAVVAGTVYNGKSFPPEYDGGFFFSDLTGGFLKILYVDADGTLVDTGDFASGLQNAVQVLVDPDSGDLYIAEIGANQILRIRYTGD